MLADNASIATLGSAQLMQQTSLMLIISIILTVKDLVDKMDYMFRLFGRMRSGIMPSYIQSGRKIRLTADEES